MLIKLFSVVLVIFLSACAQVPFAAIDLNRQVSQGISAIGDNGQAAIAAWEAVALSLVDERWGQIYKKADIEYRKKYQIAGGIALTSTQAEELAGLAALLRDEVRSKIFAKAMEMRKVVSVNTKATLDANDSVTNILISANAVLTVQQTAAKQVLEQARLPTDVNNFVKNLIN